MEAVAMEPSLTWFEALSLLRDEGRPCAVVVVTQVRGSAPREAGVRMIVSGGELVWGTIGGGKLERQAIGRAGELLAAGGSVTESADYTLGEDIGQCCGGAVTLFYETFPWIERSIAIFGAGHVAQALAGLHDYLGVAVQLIDSREEEEIRPRLPVERAWKITCVDCPEEEVDELPAGALVLIMTHDHAIDLAILERVLARGGFPYVGVIGSDRKWKRFEQRLLQRGFSPEVIESVHCPIGASKTSKQPRAIAISVAAELLDALATADRG
jgi:xanthine dehydrogenase accessory factor